MLCICPIRLPTECLQLLIMFFSRMYINVLCLLLESRSFPEVTLSPQRGSFSSGCKYKSTKDPANKDTSSDVPSTPLSARTTDDTSKFTFRDDDTSMHKEFSQYRTPHGPHSGSHYSWQRSTSHSNSYRDYNGSAAQDDKTHSKPSYSRYSHHESSGSFRGSISSQSYYQADSYSEPEPEWMQFGPSSRTDFMELGGEDEIEKLREGILGAYVVTLFRDHYYYLVWLATIQVFFPMINAL